MKTVTEFSGTVLREAALIRRAHRPAPPATPPAEAMASEPDAASVSDAAPAEAAAASVDPGAEPMPPGGEAPVGDAPAQAAPAEDASAAPAEDASADAAPAEDAVPAAEASAEAPTGEAPPPVEDPGAAKAAAEIEEKMGIKGDRLARLMEALEVVRDRADNVRLVRVLSGEDPPANAKKQGDFHYVIDLTPRNEGRSLVIARATVGAAAVDAKAAVVVAVAVVRAGSEGAVARVASAPVRAALPVAPVGREIAIVIEARQARRRRPARAGW